MKMPSCRQRLRSSIRPLPNLHRSKPMGTVPHAMPESFAGSATQPLPPGAKLCFLSYRKRQNWTPQLFRRLAAREVS
jgi:hypothetical protein